MSMFFFRLSLNLKIHFDIFIQCFPFINTVTAQLYKGYSTLFTKNSTNIEIDILKTKK